jgi:hypothetical protein
MNNNLAIEASIVGIFLAIVLGAFVAFVPLTTAWTAGVAGFIIGVGTHLFFEFTGLNARYCVSGHACASR